MGLSRVLPLVIGVLSVFFTVAERVDGGGSNGSLEIDANDNNISSTFLDRNFVQKTDEDQRYWYPDDADGTLKSKADILSHLFKMHIDRLQNKTDQVDPVEDTGQI